MIKKASFFLAMSILLAPLALAGNGGDSPLTSLEVYVGKVDFIISVNNHPTLVNPAVGEFVVSGIPEGATVIKAWLFETAIFLGDPSDIIYTTFDGFVFPPKGADASDSGTAPENGPDLNLKHYRYDVTSLVSGNGIYPYSFLRSSLFFVYGDALLVVYTHPDLEDSVISIHDGAELMTELPASRTSFIDVDAGIGRLAVFVQGDDIVERGIEELIFNDITIASGDLFDANPANNRVALIDMGVTTIQGPNDLDVRVLADETGVDVILWHLVVLKSPLSEFVDFSLEGPFKEDHEFCFLASGATLGDNIDLWMGKYPGSYDDLHPCDDLSLDIQNPRKRGIGRADENGEVKFCFSHDHRGVYGLAQAVNNETCEVSTSKEFVFE